MATQSAPSIWIVLVLAICGTWAYQPEPHSRQQSYGSYDGQGAGLSTSHQLHSTYDEHHRNNKNNYNDRIQEQPIYERQEPQTTEYFTGCPAEFTGLLPYAYDCHRFVNCFKGQPNIQSCGPGTAFNPTSLVCDHADKVSCGANALLGSQSQRTAKLLNAEPNCAPGLTGLQPHPTDCSKFLNCANGQTFVQDCGPGTAFSIAMLTCDHVEKVDCGARTYDNREPKFYAESGDNHLNQWVHGAIHGHRTTTTTTTSNGDRWSNMNMQRPSGVGYGQQETQTGYHETQQQPLAGWSGMGSSYDALAPTQSVLIVEGSLQPNRNYEQTAAHTIYQAPLAPMAPIRPSSPTTYYYAQPVDSSELESSSWQRQNHSRDINYGSHTSEWRPLPRQPVTLQQLRPNLELTPPLASEPGQQPLNLDNPYALTDQQPGETQQRPLGLYGGFEPSIPFTKSQHPKSPYPTVPANHRPTYGAQPLSNESNLYGGLLPPPAAISPATHSATTPSRVLIPPSRPTPSSNVRTFPIYPPIANAPPSQKPNYPHYSPGYAGVAHSHNASWQKVPQTNPQQHQDPFDTQQVQQEDTQYEYEDIFDSEPQRSNRQPFSTTTAKRGLSPPPFNHQFYNPAKTPNPSMNTNSTSQLPISDALRMLLRPYFNHSGTAENELAQRAESSIMAVISKPPTTAATVTTPKPTTTTTARTPRRQRPDDDAELIVAGEQESLDDTDDDSVVAGAGEIARTEQTLQPTTYASNDDTNDFYLGGRGTRKVDTDRNNWQTHGHSRDFHLRHPNLPDPYDKPNHPYHGKHDHHHHHSHSPEYHRRHPELPNPFGAHSIETEETEILAHPNAEGVTPHTQVDDFDVNLRNSFDVTPASHCEFDCGGGKCIKQIEVCDGVNNCGNRQDERQCDHLGYALKITGGESPHMGRIEVKVNGKWGYVCDDKFGLHDADVVCREVGYKMGAAEVRGNSFYAPNEQNFNYAMDELECRGNETQLKDCDFKGWGVHNCGPDEVVGVVCKVPLLKCPNDFWLCATSKECIPPAFVCDNTEDCADKSDESDAVCNAPIKYRLEGGRSPAEGRLEVKYHGEWGSICDDDFSLKSAQVACNSLGYYGPAKIEKNIFGPGKGPIWLDQVSCYGNESAIDKCSHWSWGEHNCNHTEDVGLRCQAGPPPRSRIRLQAVNNNGEKKPQLSASSLSEIGIWERSSKSLNTPRRCGIFKEDLEDEYAHPEQRVVQGAVARRGRHPWQATIRTRGRGGISSHWCGAVLISKRHLLTAAHCLYGHPKGAYFVRVGDHYANIAESSEVDSFIENWYTHEKFRDQTHMNNDIALVVLKTPVKFSDYVQPICLPESGSQLKANRSCTISGWGSIKSGVSTPSQILRSASLPILPEATCKQPHVYGSSMTDGMFCAGHLDESVDACEGDSGGPLVCSDEDGETLYGIISWGQHCGYVNKPGVYVRVGHYIDWIFEKINLSLQRN